MVFLSLRRPSPPQVEEAVLSGTRRGFNYPHVGGTSGAPPLPQEIVQERWTVDHTRRQIGQGRKAYEDGKQALKSWSHFQLGWTLVDPSTPVKQGSKVCVVAQSLLLWTRNPLEIVYVREGRWQLPRGHAKQQLPGDRKQQATGDSDRATTAASVFTFAHGCLGGHLLAGEERFALEWHKDDDSVWYEVYTFSKPAHVLSRLTYPVVRVLQKRFAADSVAAMEEAVSGGASRLGGGHG
mmetsp:Transcript_16899/g.47171  ORF Transcript_16899/g.47171 Transcript_16899/m.47171 type:complete len:238 (-) Transcript_16899:59-772(-)